MSDETKANPNGAVERSEGTVKEIESVAMEKEHKREAAEVVRAEPEMESAKESEHISNSRETKLPESEKESEAEGKVPGTSDTTSSVAATTESEGTEEGSEQDFASYEEHISYAANGEAIYTDPSTKQQYKWCSTQNKWQPLSASDSNVYETDYYKWCEDTKQWLPKPPTGSATLETEHYKWDAQQEKWVLKPQQQQQQEQKSTTAGKDVVYSVDENGERTYTDKDGVVFFWDASKSAWFPKIDDDFMARYQMNYGFIDNTSAGEHEKTERELAESNRKMEELKRMTAEAEAAMNAADNDKDDATTAAAAAGKRKVQEPPKWFDMDPAHNTKVYVSNLPLDITMDEFGELMGKCGMVMRDPQTQKYKLKLYMEADGQIKGDGLCDYIKVESVNLALEILDEYNLRGHKIRVQRAQFQMRGEYNPALKPKRRKKDKEKMQKIKEKLFDWRPDKMRGERSKHEKTVIIKNLFSPEVIKEHVDLILVYQNNLRDECQKSGTVRKVIIYDSHPEGIAQVTMSTPEEADVVIELLHGRMYGRRELIAERWDGTTKYKVEESAAEKEERLAKWNKYLVEADVKKPGTEVLPSGSSHDAADGSD